MIKKIFFFALLAGLTLLQISCESETQRRLPRHSGEPGEILIVMNEKLWLSKPGDSLRSFLEEYYPLLPQAEPSFSLLQFSEDEMSKLLRHHRNILNIQIGAKAGNSKQLTMTEEKWSNDQLLFNLRAPDLASFYELLGTELPKVISIINSKEVERTQKRYRKFGNEDLEAKLKDVYGVDISIPDDFKVSKSKKGFTWLKRERVKYIGNTAHDITQGLFFYTYPYVSDSAFNHEEILFMRDSILKEFVPGPKEGTYMTTEYLFEPQSEAIDVNGKYGVLTRGLWKTENYFMGGPFISLTTTNASNSKVICVSGFVFAPKFDKREYVRELESMLRSIEIVEKSPTPAG